MISISINERVPAFHLPVHQLRNGSKILLSFDVEDCVDVLYDEIMLGRNQEDIDTLMDVGGYRPKAEHMLLLSMKDYFSSEEERLKMAIEKAAKIEALDEASIESIERFTNKVGCFIDVEFWMKPTSWLGWLYRKVWGEGRYDHKISYLLLRYI